jgi:hypothetical protein
MKTAVKRLFACLLALSLAASLLSCGGQGESGQNAGGSGENPAPGSSASALNPDPNPGAAAGEGSAQAGGGEAVTLRMFIRNQSKYTGLQEDPIAKYVEDKLGVRIDLTVDVSLGNTTAQTSTFNELLATKLASNALDDIMDFGSPQGNPEIVSNLKRAAEAGMIIPLDDLAASTEHLGADPRLLLRSEYRRDHMYGDGKFYSLGGWGGMGLDQNPGSAPWVRWDLYRQLGYPDISTDGELLAMLERMQDMAPETPAGTKTYAFGGFWADAQGMGDGFINRDYGMSKGYESVEGNYSVYFNHATRETEDLLSDPESVFWNGVEFYFKASQMGLVDPGASMMSKAEYDDKVNNGAYLCSLNGWEMSNKEQLLAGQGIPDSGYMPLKPLEDVKSFPLYWESVLGGNEFAITSKCERPDKAIQFLDWCMSEEGSRMITQGAEGLAYVMDGDVPAATAQYREDNAAGNVDMAEVYGKWKYAGINAFQHIDLDKNGYYIQPEQIPDMDSYSAVKKDALAFYGEESFSDFWKNYANRAGQKVPNVLWGSYAAAIGDKPDDIKAKYGQINNYMYKAVFRLILAEDDAEFQAQKASAIDEVKRLGQDDVVRWYGDRYRSLRSELDPIIDSAMPAYGIS